MVSIEPSKNSCNALRKRLYPIWIWKVSGYQKISYYRARREETVFNRVGGNPPKSIQTHPLQFSNIKKLEKWNVQICNKTKNGWFSRGGTEYLIITQSNFPHYFVVGLNFPKVFRHSMDCLLVVFYFSSESENPYFLRKIIRDRLFRS